MVTTTPTSTPLNNHGTTTCEVSMATTAFPLLLTSQPHSLLRPSQNGPTCRRTSTANPILGDKSSLGGASSHMEQGQVKAGRCTSFSANVELRENTDSKFFSIYMYLSPPDS